MVTFLARPEDSRQFLECFLWSSSLSRRRYYVVLVRVARRTRGCGGTYRTVPSPVELDRSRSNVRFLVQLYVDELMCLMAVHVECTSTVP
jgi:hypothetical protein